MPIVNDDFNRSCTRLDLHAERSGIFTPGVSAVSFSEADLRHFNETTARVVPGAPPLDGLQIAGAARRLARAVGEESQAHFIRIRMRRAAEARALLADPQWTCDDALRQRMADLVAYVDGKQRLVPDDVPVIGGLDAALLVDLAMQAMRAELDEYADFCRYRSGEAARLGVEAARLALTRDQWQAVRSEEIRLERQVRRARNAGYGKSEATPGLFHVS